MFFGRFRVSDPQPDNHLKKALKPDCQMAKVPVAEEHLMFQGEEISRATDTESFPYHLKNPPKIHLTWICILFLTDDNSMLVVFQTRQMKKPCENALMQRLCQPDSQTGNRSALWLSVFHRLSMWHTCCSSQEFRDKEDVWSSNRPTKSSFRCSDSVETSSLQPHHPPAPAIELRCGGGGGGRAVPQRHQLCLVVFSSCLVPKLSPLPESQYVLKEAQWYLEPSALIHT